jgi:hypothetical protein
METIHLATVEFASSSLIGPSKFNSVPLLKPIPAVARKVEK